MFCRLEKLPKQHKPAWANCWLQARSICADQIWKAICDIELEICGPLRLSPFKSVLKVFVVAPTAKRCEIALNALHLRRIPAFLTGPLDLIDTCINLVEDILIAFSRVHAKASHFWFDLLDVWQLISKNIRISLNAALYVFKHQSELVSPPFAMLTKLSENAAMDVISVDN